MGPAESKENTIGRRIRQRRKQLGLTQEELSEKLGISYQQVQKYENGVSHLTVWRLQQIARILQAPLDLLLKDQSVVREYPPIYGGLTSEEKRLLKQFRAIPHPSTRRAILRLVRSISRLTSNSESR